MDIRDTSARRRSHPRASAGARRRRASSTSAGSAALTRYYVAAGAGGVAVGVHTTQFAIRDPQLGLFEPVLELAADATRCGETAAVREDRRRLRAHARRRVQEAELARSAGLRRRPAEPGGAARRERSSELLDHCRAVGDDHSRRRILPAAGGGRPRAVVRVLARVRRDRERGGDQDGAVQPLPDASTWCARSPSPDAPTRSRSTPATTTTSSSTC